jgi:L-galactose dehydrogenase
MIVKQLGTTGFEVSPLGLGTVEIGLPYGIGATELPTDKEAEEDPRGEELERRIRDDIETSLTMLQVDSLQLVQLHGGSQEQIERGEVIEIMQKLMDEGKVRHVGIATRGEEAPLAAVASGFFATIQTAYSILDQRMAKEVLPQAKENNVGIINRSVLLKGALTPAVWQLPPQLDPLKENSAKAAAIAKELHIDLPTLAFRFVLSNEAVTCALLGTVTPAHLRTALNALEAGPLPEEIVKKLRALAINDPSQVDPAQWPKV